MRMKARIINYCTQNPTEQMMMMVFADHLYTSKLYILNRNVLVHKTNKRLLYKMELSCFWVLRSFELVQRKDSRQDVPIGSKEQGTRRYPVAFCGYRFTEISSCIAGRNHFRVSANSSSAIRACS